MCTVPLLANLAGPCTAVVGDHDQRGTRKIRRVHDPVLCRAATTAALYARSSATEPPNRSSSISAVPGIPAIVALFVNCQNVHFDHPWTAAGARAPQLATHRSAFEAISATPGKAFQKLGDVYTSGRPIFAATMSNQIPTLAAIWAKGTLLTTSTSSTGGSSPGS